MKSMFVSIFNSISFCVNIYNNKQSTNKNQTKYQKTILWHFNNNNYCTIAIENQIYRNIPYKNIK